MADCWTFKNSASMAIRFKAE